MNQRCCTNQGAGMNKEGSWTWCSGHGGTNEQGGMDEPACNTQTHFFTSLGIPMADSYPVLEWITDFCLVRVGIDERV